MSKEVLEVTIKIIGGVPYILNNPNSINVKVIDYDVEAKAYDETELSKDKKGVDYIYYEL